MHPAIQEELDMLRERFPNCQELTLDDYANFFRINRRYAPQHFKRLNSGSVKLPHKKIGKLTLINLQDFAEFLARHRVDAYGHQIVIISADMSTRRGFSRMRST